MEPKIYFVIPYSTGGDKPDTDLADSLLGSSIATNSDTLPDAYPETDDLMKIVEQVHTDQVSNTTHALRSANQVRGQRSNTPN